MCVYICYKYICDYAMFYIFACLLNRIGYNLDLINLLLQKFYCF